MAASSACFASGLHLVPLRGAQCMHGTEPVAGTREGHRLPSCFLGQQLDSRAALALVDTRPNVQKGQAPGRRASVVRAGKAKKSREDRDPNYPWPKEVSKAQGFLSFLSKFKDSDPDRKIMKLPFEKELEEMEKSYLEINEMARRTGEIADFQAVLRTMEEKMQKLRVKIYSNLSPVQRLSVARHPNRPTFLDHVLNITDKWVELHGDRGGYDDPALVCGIGEIDGMSFMLMGHQKGRNTKENIARNFGMPTPNGYRKALRLMRHAEHHGFPILTFIDTPGAYAGVSAEELGQGEAIAHNLRDMFSLTVPIVTTVIGEGGSGGALAIGCCDRMVMMENAVYYVASPEACAAILWKTAKAAPKATEALKITGYELQNLNVVDEVIREPVGGAHADPYQASMNVKEVIMKHVKELLEYDNATLESKRLAKFRYMGAVNVEGGKDNARWHRNMKPREAPPMAEKVPPLQDVPLILANQSMENGRSSLSEAPAEEVEYTTSRG